MTDAVENAEVEAGETVSEVQEIKTLDDAVAKARETLSAEPDGSAPEPATAEPAPETDPAPEHWAKDHKELYGKLKDPEARALVKEFDKTFHQLHQKKASEVMEPIKQAFAPFAEELRANNMTEVQAISALVSERKNFMHQMQTNGKQYLMSLAQQFNIPLDDVEFGEPNTQVVALQNQVNELTRTLQGFQQQGIERQQSEINSQIEAFANAKDEAGNARYPHFDTVVDEMALQIAAAKQQGVTMTLEDAYKRAVRANDELYQQEVKRELEKQEAQRKADVEKAKANKHLSGRAPVQSVVTVKSPLDAVAMARQQISSRAS
jgi:hypothetical protein